MGLPLYTSIGSGTLKYSTSSMVCAISPHASTLPGDLVVCVCALGHDNFFNLNPKDPGDGWIILGSFRDPTDMDGGFFAACIAPRAGAAGWASIPFTSDLAIYYDAQVHTYRIVQPARFALGQVGVADYIYNSASGTPLQAPAINQPYQQVIDLIGRGYNNNGTTTTVGNITNFTERFDTGEATGQYGIVLNDRTAQITGAVQNPLVTSNLAVAKTRRVGFRAMIPIIGNTMNRGRLQGSRRLFG